MTYVDAGQSSIRIQSNSYAGSFILKKAESLPEK